jgi:HSP20 family protein
MSANERKDGRFGIDFTIGGLLGGLLDGLPEQIRQKLDAELAQKLGDLTGGPSAGSGPTGRGVNVGFRVRRAAPGTSGVTVEPFGDVKPDAATGRPVVAEFAEPPADVFEEADHVLVLVELPGCAAEDVHVAVSGSALTVSTTGPRKRYRKEVALPFAPAAGKLTHTCRNGVLEVRADR